MMSKSLPYKRVHALPTVGSRIAMALTAVPANCALAETRESVAEAVPYAPHAGPRAARVPVTTIGGWNVLLGPRFNRKGGPCNRQSPASAPDMPAYVWAHAPPHMPRVMTAAAATRRPRFPVTAVRVTAPNGYALENIDSSSTGPRTMG